MKVTLHGITVEIHEADLGFYLNAGYKRVDEQLPVETPEVVSPELPGPVESPKPSRTRTKKSGTK